jgi:hypothetical protein
MSDNVKNVFSAIMSGNMVDLKGAIEATMQEKIASQLETRKIEIAKHLVAMEEVGKRGGPGGNSTVSKNAYKPVKHGDSDGPVDINKGKGSTYLKYQHDSGAYYTIHNPGQDHTGLTSSFKATHFDKEGKKTKDDFKNIAHLKAYTKSYHKKLGESLEESFQEGFSIDAFELFMKETYDLEIEDGDEVELLFEELEDDDIEFLMEEFEEYSKK